MLVRGIRAIILDIEGTTTPLAFVTGTLFPYARRHVRAYFDAHPAAAARAITRLRVDRERETDPSCPPWSDATPDARRDAAVAYVEWLIDRDSKLAALKDLQGRIWEQGYHSGELTGEVFPDVPRALERWARAGVRAGIFSSGSVLAQRLLFLHSSAGDLTPYLHWHFDTGIGPKREPTSYTRIAASLSMPAAHVLFVSDMLPELDAARAAGMQTVMSVRPGNAPQPPHDHRVVRSFEEI